MPISISALLYSLSAGAIKQMGVFRISFVYSPAHTSCGVGIPAIWNYETGCRRPLI